ncbi:MAG: nitroreductase family protein [Candidatus Poseidoniales archaeon]|jgi:iodotyrosine deiodinase|tara:strand:+ start:557 stop:1231 length:675 start_codon:yes stop_codon:yes gene_type:complete
MGNIDLDFTQLDFDEMPAEVMVNRASEFYKLMNKRRTTRHFAKKKVDRKLIEFAIKTASTAPSGAHLQPWTFVAISNIELKKKIRKAAEKEERKTYDKRMPESWSELLKPLGTDYIKEHITDAPWIIIIFRQSKWQRNNLEWGPTYYSQESCGISVGLFIAAIQNMGLVTLTHTPSPMNFLRDILERPKHEHAMLLMPVGYPAKKAKVPNLSRKEMNEVIKWKE